MSFYMYMCSSDFANYYPQNKSTNFRIKLPQQIDGSSYEIALVSLSYNNTRSIFTQEQDRIVHLYTDGLKHEFLLPVQKYANVGEFVQTLNEMIEDYTESISIKIDENEKIQIRSLNNELCISKKVADILGTEQMVFADSVYFAKYQASLDNIDRDVFVQLDTLVPQYVGECSMQFLNVASPSYTLTPVDITFKPLYIQASPHVFESVLIRLTDRNGREVSLNNTDTKLIVHFQKRDGG